MDPKLYVEVDTDLLGAAAREYFGRCYCMFAPPDGLGATEYPAPPDSWPGMNDTPPAPPPARDFTWYWIDPFPKVGGGAIFKLDDPMLVFVTGASITLSDGNAFAIDLSTAAKTFEQLSAAGQVAATPPIIEI